MLFPFELFDLTVAVLFKIWVYGDSFKSMLVAVVVPHEENTKKWAYSHGHMGSFSELCSLEQLQKHVLSELKSTAENKKVVEQHSVVFSFC